jgi:hypothetical protein
MFFGQKAQALKAERTPRNAALILHYLGQRPVNVRGAITGSFYEFSQHQPVQPVDAKDAVFLLGTRLFRLAQ